MKNKNSREGVYYLPIGLCLGMSAGTALGIALDKMPVYMSVGMSVGLCIGALLDADRRKKADAAKSDKDGRKEE